MNEKEIMEALKALIQEAAENDLDSKMNAATGALMMVVAAKNAGLEEMLFDLLNELDIDPDDLEGYIS